MTDGVYDRYVREQQRHLAEENLRLKAERDRLETDLGQARQRIEQLLQRAENAETARDQLAVGVPLVCSDERHASKVRGLETQLAELQNEEAGDWMNEMLWARKLAFWAEPPVGAAFGDGAKSWFAVAAEEARQQALVAARLADYLADHAVPGLNGQPPSRSCPPACAESHLYDGACLLDPCEGRVVSWSTWPGQQGWAYSCDGEDGCEGHVSYGHSSAAAARRAHDRHLKREHLEVRP
jgi:hypothetical protein